MRAFTILAASILAIAAAVAVMRGRVLGEVEAEPSAPPALAAPSDPNAVASVRILGSNLPVAALERSLSTRVGVPLREEDIARDRAAMLATLEARGHLGASITDVRVTWSNGAHVAYEIDAAGVYTVDVVLVVGAPPRLATELANVPTLLRGQPWQPERAAENVTLVRDWLAHRGVHGEVIARRTVDHVRHTVDVTFEYRVPPKMAAR